ncbi:MAG: glycosyltransferase family 2 protein [Balneolaceae bacterium]
MAETLLTCLLLFACICLIFSSLILVRNRFDLTCLPDSAAAANAKQNSRGNLRGKANPSVSLLIPARNEEESIEKCVRHACGQNYPEFEVLVLDDCSSDHTADILDRLEAVYPEQLHILKGREKPENWLGKPWACAQLAEAASGNYLLFIDADVFINPETLNRLANAFHIYQLDMLTVWPRQELVTFWEKTLIPLVYYALTTLLPAVYVYRRPRWMPFFLHLRTRRLFAAACGQFIAFHRKAYEQAGGHAGVRDKPVEDVSLARATRHAGLQMRMFEGGDLVRCRMYKNEREIRNGFRKNFFAGFSYSFPLFTAGAVWHLIVYVLPFIMLPVAYTGSRALWLVLSATAVGIIFIHWLILSAWFRWNPFYALTHPLAVLWFQHLGLLTLYDRLTGRPAVWKGRRMKAD